MERERALDTDSEGLLPHGERLAEAGPLALDADSLEHLNPLAIALDDLEMDTQRVPRLELRHVRAQVALLEALDRRIHKKGRPEDRRGMVADAHFRSTRQVSPMTMTQ